MFIIGEHLIFMNMEENIILGGLEKLEEQVPVKGKWKALTNSPNDGQVQLVHNRKRYQFHAEIKRELRHDHIAGLLKIKRKDEALLVAAAHISNGVKKALRKEHINYIEANGNAFIQSGELIVFVDSNNPVVSEKAIGNRAFMKTGLKAVFYLLNHPEAANYNYRKLAAATNIALGNIKYIMDGLREANFLLQVDKNTVRLRNLGDLLERWLVGYREVLRPTLLLGTYSFDGERNNGNSWRNMDMQKASCLWGGEPAADLLTNYLQPGRFQLYTNQNKIQVMLALFILPNANGKGEIELYKQFWDRQHYPDYNGCVPPLLVYTDLLLTNDPRCAEAAQIIYEKYLKANVAAYQ